MNKRIVQLSVVSVLLGFTAAASFAAGPTGSPVAELNLSELGLLENRFFSHSYAHDPAEKRLERLECLVYGSTRDGNNSQRLARLMATVAARSQQPLLAADKPAQVKNETVKDRKEVPAPSSSKQYPVLNTLEWRALKKTFPAESLDQRLDRLESKLFGQPAQTMAYVDRVERLKKTVGIGLEQQSQPEVTAVGPMPKARPRGEEDDFFSAVPQVPSIGGGILPPSASGVSPFNMLGGIDPFGDTAFGGLGRMHQMLLNSMSRQMSEMQRLGPGTWVQDPKTKDYIDIGSGRRVGPDGKAKPSVPSAPTLPGTGNPFNSDGQLRDLPGYADPNSI